MIADESALHSIFGCKGAGGLKPCLLCQNVFNTRDTRGIVATDESGWAVAHDCCDSGKLVPHTTGTIDAICRRLSAARLEMTKGAFNDLQTRLGWNYIDGGLMELRHHRQLVDPTWFAVFDWMHVFFVSGVFNIHMGLLIEELAQVNVTCKMLNEYVDQWHWPVHIESKSGGSNGPLSEKRSHSSRVSGVFKATASEGLSLMPILTHFLVQLAANTASENFKKHVDCFELLAGIIATIRSAARVVVNHEELKCNIELYLTQFKSIYGSEHMVPKFHSMLHFPKFIRRCPILPNCFVLERKHKQPKRFANEVRNTASNWDESIARDVTNRHVASLNGRVMADGLRPPVNVPSPAVRAQLQSAFGAHCDFKIAKSARVNAWETVSRRDIVLMQIAGIFVVGRIALLAEVAEDGESRHTVCQVECYEFVKTAGKLGGKYRNSGRISVQLVQDVVCALMWSGTDRVLTALHPSHVLGVA